VDSWIEGHYHPAGVVSGSLNCKAVARTAREAGSFPEYKTCQTTGTSSATSGKTQPDKPPVVRPRPVFRIYGYCTKIWFDKCGRPV